MSIYMYVGKMWWSKHFPTQIIYLFNGLGIAGNAIQTDLHPETAAYWHERLGIEVDITVNLDMSILMVSIGQLDSSQQMSATYMNEKGKQDS